MIKVKNDSFTFINFYKTIFGVTLHIIIEPKRLKKSNGVCTLACIHVYACNSKHASTTTETQQTVTADVTGHMTRIVTSTTMTATVDATSTDRSSLLSADCTLLRLPLTLRWPNRAVTRTNGTIKPPLTHLIAINRRLNNFLSRNITVYIGVRDLTVGTIVVALLNINFNYFNGV